MHSIRRLTSRGYVRLMDYPDSYKISPSINQSYKQLGNSVVVDVLQYIGLEIGKTLTNMNNICDNRSDSDEKQ